MPPKSAPAPRSAGKATNHSRAKRAPLSLNTGYLIAYNLASAVAWGSVLWTMLSIGMKKGWDTGHVFDGTDRLVRLTQSAAGLEILHSLLGVVRSPLLTTLMQVASRFLLVWGITYNFPEVARHSPIYSTMLLAWSITEVIRYGFFVFSLSGMGVPSLWTWLRYNTFIILYPLGISSECWLIWKAISPASKQSPLLPYGLYAILAVYVPGAFILISHMAKQRMHQEYPYVTGIFEDAREYWRQFRTSIGFPERPLPMSSVFCPPPGNWPEYIGWRYECEREVIMDGKVAVELIKIPVDLRDGTEGPGFRYYFWKL